MSVYLFGISFLLGSIPFGKLKLKRAGGVTFFLDMGKGALAASLATPVGFQFLMTLFNGGLKPHGFEVTPLILWASSLCAVLGQCYSPFLKFKGGKGVATALGVLLVLSPVAALLGVIGFFVTFCHRKIVALASLAGTAVAAVTYVVLNPIEVHLWMGLALVFVIFARHEVNIDALLENREPTSDPLYWRALF